MMINQMQELGQRLEAHRKEQEKLTKELHNIIIAAYTEGNSAAFIAKTIGVTRQTVYTAIKSI